VIGAVLLELVGGVDGGGQVAGLDLVEDGLGGGDEVEVLGGGGMGREEGGSEEEE
jgi:hypothetical protein